MTNTRIPNDDGMTFKIKNPCPVHPVSRQESLPKGFGFPLQLLDHSPLLSCRHIASCQARESQVDLQEDKARFLDASSFWSLFLC